MTTHPHPAHPGQHPASTPTAPAVPAYTPLKWSFPFTPIGKDDTTDPMTYMKALAKAEDGFYPLGSSGMWHGGVHFDQGTAAMLKQEAGVRAIADGEVVAYRMDSKYPEQVYQDGRHALYSTSFVLIRHKLQLPPKPASSSTQAPTAQANSTQPASVTPPAASSAPAASAPAAGNPQPDETLTFFSLYMHLADWDTYQTQQKEVLAAPNTALAQPMPYWEGDRYFRVGDKAKDHQKLPKPKASPASTASNDVLGDFINAGFVLPQQTTAAPPADNTPQPAPVKGIRILDLPNGKMIGLLPKGAELMISDTDPQHPGWGKIKSIKSGQPVAPIVGKSVSEHAQWSWVFVNELDLVVDPKPLDTVVVLKKPYPVKAGEVVGQLGHYLRYTDAKLLKAQPTRSLLHLEILAGPELKAFIAKSRLRAKELPAAKTFLEVSPGAMLVAKIPDPNQTLPQIAGGLKLVPLSSAMGSRWIKVQPKRISTPTSSTNHPHPGQHPALTNQGNPLWVEAALANTTTTNVVKGWSDFPLSLNNIEGPGADFRDVFRRVDLDKLGAENIAIDEKSHHWWNITIGARDGSTRQGWVCEENHPLTRMCGAWDWPGFELVDNGSLQPAEMFQRYIHVTDQYLADENKSEYEPSALKVNAAEMIVKLEKAIDCNHDGKVTALELKHAQETPWMAEAISHLVVRSGSEWGGGIGKWESLAPMMKKLLWLWQAEIERIGKLQWWDQASGIEGFPTDPTPWHMHPIGIIGNFSASPVSQINDFNEEDAKDALRYIFDKYGRSIAEIVERMYRVETRHFHSMQYRRCGTGGMEIHGNPPAYGWNPAFFTELPTGTWSAYEGAGLSGAGGNAQVTDHPKTFVVVSSVRIGMEFKARYIVAYNGNYARWFSTEAHAQEVYRATLNTVEPRIVNSFH
ncbi:hypothetical protein [Paraburkholderia bannensis]|uniref:hypothetical protein n=2 Tax=Paraburkholderia bannensis TaxID=765414 RepID=UPI002AB0FB13|nr:hypothetical protein [Paraburkholderia bannensis]